MVDGGPGLPVFSESVFHYIAKGTPRVGEVEDVPDPVVRKNLSQLRLVQTTEDLRNMVTSEDFVFLLDCGFPKPLALLQLAERDEIVECAIVHYTHYRIRGELDQLKEGLAKVGVLEAITRDPDLFKPLFCWDSSLQVTTGYIRWLFDPKLSEVGSNARSQEEDLLYNWEEYLKEIDDEGRARAADTEVTLEELFAFLTGSHSIPPMGFERPGSIVFIPLENPKESRLPSVSTCIPQLSIPICNYILEDFDNFKKQINLAVLGSMEFGQP
ncbi:G2/M phase-specific E3 ubiquitin-protein ligase-like [Montipora capricornis]|uniref:G2/M phase-specific E3 ubiquitin-protein ligase-like n=1 Tax=Montipora capricornis TaxID=246305 RepID=UPI0035F12AD9